MSKNRCWKASEKDCSDGGKIVWECPNPKKGLLQPALIFTCSKHWDPKGEAWVTAGFTEQIEVAKKAAAKAKQHAEEVAVAGRRIAGVSAKLGELVKKSRDAATKSSKPKDRA